MRAFLKVTSFILIAIGTIGLLANKFILQWGRPAPLTFAVFNLVGLGGLIFTNLRDWTKHKELSNELLGG
jgi:hypothetical protein